MLPVRLYLRNFMSYGEPGEEINLRGIRLACISGNNGEGKSALLDAITWVLWGVARGTDLRGAGADDLIRTGSDEVQVVLEFEVGVDLWRVDRNRRRGKVGNLALSRHDGDDWVNASGATTANTQRLINTLLGLDYQTFINSAFLLQGRADEFSRQGASDRKRILGDILGLNVFDTLSEQAKAQAREARARSEALEIEISRLVVELAQEETLLLRERELAESSTQLRAILQQLRQDAETEQDRLAMLAEMQRRVITLQNDLAKISQQAMSLRKEQEDLRVKLAECRQSIDRSDAIEAGMAQLLAARTAERDWGSKAAAFAALARQREEHTVIVEREAAALQSREKWLKEQLSALTLRSQDDEIKRRIDAHREAITTLNTRQQEAIQLQLMTKDEHTQIARNEERIRLLQLSQAEKKDSLALLNQAESQCPVCKGILSQERRAELIDEHQRELVEIAQQLIECADSIRTLNSKLKQQDAHIKEIQQERPRLAELEQKLGKFESLLAQVETTRQQRDATQSELNDIEAKLQSRQYAIEATQALSKIADDVAALGYDAAAHKSSAEQAKALAHFENEKAKLDQALATAEIHQTALARVATTLDSFTNEMTRLESELTLLKTDIIDLPQVTARYAGLVAQVKKNETELVEIDQQIAVVRSEIARLAESSKVLLARQKEKERALEDSIIHADLATAFGRNGVQALIIETALPQLEAHANDLLDRLTDGRMQVSFITQKERAGDMAETLEIRTRDENGERRYEMYSGGEAFRLNFAIRLALSQLLTQRAGARLSTLVIDEGFGSQDTEGRQRLIDAILTVSEDFELILVITHLDELKAEFPTRLEVWKDDEGSHVRRIQHSV